MALIMKYIDSMHHYMNKYGDPRTQNWPLMSSPFPTLALCLGYVYLVKVLGPRLMENRKPFQLKNTLILYNFLQVVFSAWLFYETERTGQPPSDAGEIPAGFVLIQLQSSSPPNTGWQSHSAGSAAGVNLPEESGNRIQLPRQCSSY